jgi:hypothetical protein
MLEQKQQEVFQHDFTAIPQAPEAMQSFKGFKFDKEQFDLPLIALADTNARIVALSFLHSLGQLREPTRDIRSEMERFSFAYENILNDDNWEDFIQTLPYNDCSGHKQFTHFLEAMVDLQDTDDIVEMWREVLSCSVIFTLREDVREQLLKQRQSYNSNYGLLEAHFN